MGSSIVTFSNNHNKITSIIYSDNSFICFKENSSTMFYNNTGSAILLIRSNISFQGNSYTLFYNNTARTGGAIYNRQSNIFFEEKSTTDFCYNTAKHFSEKSFLYIHQIANNDGGAIYSVGISHITFGGNSTALFSNNIADYHGGAVFTESYIVIRFCDNATVTFTKNQAKFGATVHCTDDSKIMATGDFTVIFDGLQAKWCTNVCMPSTGQSDDTVLFDSNGVVWCTYKEAFVCLSSKCHCMKLEDIMVPTTKVLITHITDKVVLSSTNYLESISIIGHNKLTVLCINDKGLSLKASQRLIVENITWVGCGDSSTFLPVLSIYESANVTIKNCSFQHSLGIVIEVKRMKGLMNITDCNFMSNNHYKDHGSAIKYTSTMLYYQIYPLKINNCTFSYNGVAESIIYLEIKIDIHALNNFHIYIINSVFYSNNGASIYLSVLSPDYFKCKIYLHISRKVMFKDNVAKNGAGIYLESGHSIVILDKGSDVTFINNSAEHSGSAVYMSSYSHIIFGYNARVEFNNNKASNGTIYSDDHSKVIFMATSLVTFSDNSVTQYGAAIYSSDNSHIYFTESSNVTFRSNIISSTSENLKIGGIIFSDMFHLKMILLQHL